MDGLTVAIGEMRRELWDNRTVYVIDLDEAETKRAIAHINGNPRTFIPGLDIVEDGYYVAYQRIPYIVEMRVPDRRREDIDEICAAVGMEFYDEFTYFLKKKGYMLDEWSVEEIPV